MQISGGSLVKSLQEKPQLKNQTFSLQLSFFLIPAAVTSAKYHKYNEVLE